MNVTPRPRLAYAAAAFPCGAADSLWDWFRLNPPPPCLHFLNNHECNPRAPAHAGYAYVSNVAVLPAARRRGVARQLMAAAEALAAEWGCKAVGLHCNTKKTAPWVRGWGEARGGR